jgi:hypothetical protein
MLAFLPLLGVYVDTDTMGILHSGVEHSCKLVLGRLPLSRGMLGYCQFGRVYHCVLILYTTVVAEEWKFL